MAAHAGGLAAPDPAGEHGGGGDPDHAEQYGGYAIFQEGSQPEGGEESQHDGRQGGHDFHGGFDDAFDVSGQEVGGINGGQQSDWDGEEHGPECAFERTEDQWDQREFGLEFVITAGALPNEIWAGCAFVPDAVEECGDASFWMRVMNFVEVQNPLIIEEAGVFEFAIDGDGGRCERQFFFPAGDGGGGVAQGDGGLAAGQK